MISKIRIFVNDEEVEKAELFAERTGVYNIPEKIIKGFEFGFRLEDVSLYYLNSSNQIIIYLNGEYFEIEYNEMLHSKLRDKFK